jgi:hypothetical protein
MHHVFWTDDVNRRGKERKNYLDYSPLSKISRLMSLELMRNTG